MVARRRADRRVAPVSDAAGGSAWSDNLPCRRAVRRAGRSSAVVGADRCRGPACLDSTGGAPRSDRALGHGVVPSGARAAGGARVPQSWRADGRASGVPGRVRRLRGGGRAGVARGVARGGALVAARLADPACGRRASVLVALSLAGRTVARNDGWSSRVALWAEAAGYAPGHWMPQLALGEALHDAGQHR